jgi:aminoglycoside phosphotransferase (APT) family kinase protein
MKLEWTERGGEDFLDLAATGAEGAGTWLAVRPHAEEGYFRPVCVLVPGEEERELGDGVLGREHARDTIVKYAIQTLAQLHGVPATRLESGEDDPWPARTVAALWALLAGAPHST